MKLLGIYKIRNILNDKVYIGSSIHIKRRLSEHKCWLRKNTHDNDYLQKAWNKYGENNFVFEIVELLENKLQLEERETYWINHFNSCDDEFGYNLIIDVQRQTKVHKQVAWNKGIKTGIVPANKDSWKNKASLEQLILYYNDEHSVVECRKYFGISEEVVSRILRENNVIRSIKETMQLPKWRKKSQTINKGKTPWNKGLTAKTDSRIVCRVYTEEQRKIVSDRNKNHIVSEETKNKIRKGVLANYARLKATSSNV